MFYSEKLVNRDAIRTYLNFLFSGLTGIITLQGVGEKGTEREGIFREQIFLDLKTGYMDEAIRHVCRWSALHVASYILPATLKERSDEEWAIDLFSAVTLDIDDGDTYEKLLGLAKYVGVPTMVVCSGGRNKTGHCKFHCYWGLERPARDIKVITSIRREWSERVGGDTALSKPNQLMRIPGSVYGRNGIFVPVSIFSFLESDQWQGTVLPTRCNFTAQDLLGAPPR